LHLSGRLRIDAALSLALSGDPATRFPRVNSQGRCRPSADLPRMGGSLIDMEKFMAEERKRWTEVIRGSNLSLE